MGGADENFILALRICGHHPHPLPPGLPQERFTLRPGPTEGRGSKAPTMNLIHGGRPPAQCSGPPPCPVKPSSLPIGQAGQDDPEHHMLRAQPLPPTSPCPMTGSFTPLMSLGIFFRMSAT